MSSKDQPPPNDVGNAPRAQNRLILCFDGTGDTFQGNTNDTNIVKLLDMFDRSAPHQMHYYQPGIGTYSINGSVNTNFLGRVKRKISQTIDEALATSFDAHVIAGYRFLMRYYGTGDKIFIFGFSRGAFTARFLARMVSHVGLLSMGNEEMVPFAYKVYQDYETLSDNEERRDYLTAFRQTFCRHKPHESANDARPEGGVKIHFLGLFDTVNSVATLDLPFRGTMKVPDVLGTATHVRHAVAIDERRVKFKAALCAQDQSNNVTEDIKEVWFPGNHGDVGGGWPAESENPPQRLNRGQWLRRMLCESKSSEKPHMNKTNDKFQLSDISLKWMIDELDRLSAKERPADRVQWDTTNKNDFFARFTRSRPFAVKGRMHDTLTVGGGASIGMVMMWKLMEYLPLIRRWEYITSSDHSPGEWDYVRFPLNKGGTRDIPPNALFHHSVIERLRLQDLHYRPQNQTSIGANTVNLCNVDPQDVQQNGRSFDIDTAHFAIAERPKGSKETDWIYELK